MDSEAIPDDLDLRMAPAIADIGCGQPPRTRFSVKRISLCTITSILENMIIYVYYQPRVNGEKMNVDLNTDRWSHRADIRKG
jgi:hypothetical protein